MDPIQLLLESLIKYYPQIAGYGFLIIIVTIVVYKCTKFYLKTEEVCKEFPNLQSLLQKIDKGFSTLNQILIEKDVIGSSCYSGGGSPRVLNERGEKLYKQSGAEKLLNEIKSDLLSEVEKQKQDSLLELEQNAIKILLEKMKNPEFKEIQDFAYNNQSFEGTPLTYTDILLVMALELRDMYIGKHPEIKPEIKQNIEKV